MVKKKVEQTKRTEQTRRNPSGRNSLKSFSVSMSLVLALFAAILVASSLDASSPTGHAAVQTIGHGREGTELYFEVRNIPAMKAATVEFSGTVLRGQIRFDEDESIPFNGVSLSKFVVSSPQAASIGQMTFNLKIAGGDLAARGITQEEVRLYLNGEEQPISLDSREGRYVFYTAAVPSMGKVVIGKGILEAEAAEELPPREVSGDFPVPSTAGTTPEPSGSDDETEAAEPEMQPSGTALPQPSSPGIMSRIFGFLRRIFQ